MNDASLDRLERTTREQRIQEQAFRHRAMESTILEAAIEKWQEEREFGGDVDTKARTVTIGEFAGSDERTTYRYGFGVNGELLLWNEEEGENPPEELAVADEN